MSNSSTSFLPAPLLNIQKKLVEFILDLSSFRTQNTKQSTITAFFIFNPFLTQSNLYKLTHISRGTISEILQSLVSQKILQKRYNRSLKQNEYSLILSHSQTSVAFSESKAELAKNIEYLTACLKNLKNNLINFQDIQSKKDSGQLSQSFPKFQDKITSEDFKQIVNLIQDRISELIITYSIITDVTDWVHASLKSSKKDLPTLFLKKKSSRSSSHSKLKDSFLKSKALLLFLEQIPIFNELKIYLINHQILRHHEPSTAEVLALFVLLENFTQNEIRVLLNLSKGKISQIFQELELFGYIQKEEPRTRPYRYHMSSILQSNLQLFLQSIEKLIPWESILCDYQIKLEELSEAFSSDLTYQKMRGFLNSIFLFFPVYKRLRKNLSKFLSKKS